MGLFNLSDEDIQRAAKSYTEEMAQKQLKKMIFITSRQDEVMESIYKKLKIKKLIDNDDIAYFPKKFEFTREEFQWLFDSIMDYAADNNLINEEEDNSFPNAYMCLKYKRTKILLRIMWGQGCCMQMRTDLPEEWKNGTSFTYEEFKKSQLEEKND